MVFFVVLCVCSLNPTSFCPHYNVGVHISVNVSGSLFLFKDNKNMHHISGQAALFTIHGGYESIARQVK